VWGHGHQGSQIQRSRLACAEASDACGESAWIAATASLRFAATASLRIARWTRSLQGLVAARASCGL